MPPIGNQIFSWCHTTQIFPEVSSQKQWHTKEFKRQQFLNAVFLLLHYNNFRAVVCMPTPLGMESGAILDSQIRASSIWHPNYAAQQARLHFKAGGGKSGSWSSLFNDNNQWLQVDLQQTTRVKGIATQGKNAFSQWVTRYKLQYGEDGHTFKFYRQKGDHLDTVWLSSCQGREE